MILQPLYLTTSGNVMLQNKTVSPSTSSQTIGADTGYDGLGTVTVSAVSLQNKTVTPTTSAQSITKDSGYHGLGTVTVNAIPSNYIVPSGTLSITTVGTFNVTNYASATVQTFTNSKESSTTTSSYVSFPGFTTIPERFLIYNQHNISSNQGYTFLVFCLKLGASDLCRIGKFDASNCRYIYKDDSPDISISGTNLRIAYSDARFNAGAQNAYIIRY